MTSSAFRPTGHRIRLRRLLGTVTVSAVGGVLLLGSPAVVHPARPTEAAPPGATLAPVAMVSTAHRWPGHPGRTLVGYRVRPGDTATGLAVRFHAWTRELRAINHLGRQARLYVGERLRIPVVDAAARRHRHARHHAHRGRHHVHRRPHASAHSGHLRRQHSHARPHPKPWRQVGATRAQVRRVVVDAARRHRVDRDLALAIAWQESGWQQHRISSAGAVGVMQVLPSTGRWMSLYVGRRLNVYALGDNVESGVVLIRVLRGQTSVRRSVAAYYQGLGSVRSHGLYPSTRHYVRNVLALHRRLDGGWNPS